jgi:hypothetical protein
MGGRRGGSIEARRLNAAVLLLVAVTVADYSGNRVIDGWPAGPERGCF